jgi:hypothetical protein
MKPYIFFLFFFSIVISFGLNAQQKTIIEELESSSFVNSEGTISVESDPAITALLGVPLEKTGKEANGFIKMNGFRIRIFMGNNPRSAKEEAFRKENQLKEKFPELATYVNYDAPNWKLYAGDFLTKDEAMIFRKKIQKAFPEFGKEIYTVIDRINVPVYSPVE